MLDAIGPVNTFGFFFGLCFLASGAVLARRLRETGRNPDWAYEMIVAALVGGLIGAKALFLLQNPDELDGLGAIFGGSGLVWYGGALGGAAGVLLWARRRGALGTWVFDACAPGLAIGYAVGRIGCQISGDGDYGKAWDGPWAMAYPDGVVPIDIPVHPTPIYEALVMTLLAWGLWRLRHRVRPGGLFGLYLLGSGLQRFLVEFLRRNDDVLAGLTLAQVQSVALFVGGVLLLLKLGGPFERERANSLKPTG